MAGNNSGSKDEALDGYPEGDSGLSASYRQAASELPPQHLDRAILSASRKALRARKHLAFSPFASDWHIPVSLAAILVLSVALVVTMRREQVPPTMEEPVQRIVSPSADDSRQPATESGMHGNDSALTAPAIPAQSKVAPPVPADSNITRARPAPEAAAGPQQLALPEHVPVTEFKKLFVEHDTPGGTPGAARQDADTTAAFAQLPAAPQVEKPRSRTPPERAASLSVAPLAKKAGSGEQKAARISESVHAKVGVQISRELQLPAHQFIAALRGPWSGTAVTTPLGPVAYDITFKPVPDECITGTANPGTHHTWTFCVHDKGLVLDFLTDFRGNRTPIHFRQLAYNDGVYSFKADTHDFMKVLVFAGESTAWMKIFHYGKLHVEIQLTKK